MTPLIWTWLLSLIGAGLFFAAGTTLSLRRSALGGSSLRTPPASAELTLAASQLDAASADAAREALERERTAEADRRSLLLSELDAERARVRTVEAAHQRLEATARAAQLELEAARSKVLELTQRATPDARTAALQLELALSQESLRARDRQLEQLREEATRLHIVEQELNRTQRELEAEREQARVLRSQAFVARPPSIRPSSPVAVSAHVRSLQSIVDTETRMGRAKSAVIADELGLLVAASGATNEYGDALAAMGAYLTGVGVKTRGILPLNEVSQVVVRDDHDVILTVRPLAADDPGLALVTLAVGPNPNVPIETAHN